MASEPAKRVELRYEVPVSSPHWTLDDDEERMPENPLQVAICDLLKLILVAWCRRRDADALVSGNVALRWDPLHPKVGVDPDVYLVEPRPPLGHKSKSLRTWVKGHSPPRVAVEVVSDATADVDYNVKPAKYAASRTRELWIFDPLMVGPRGGDAVRLQVWRREARRGFRRVYAGEGPARSEELGAWLVVTDGGERLRIADHADGTGLWRTGEEEARAHEDEARARAEEARAHEVEARTRAEEARARAEEARAAELSERAAKEAALAEVERLRAELARVTGNTPGGART